jgi:GAF domain-containing protein
MPAFETKLRPPFDLTLEMPRPRKFTSGYMEVMRKTAKEITHFRDIETLLNYVVNALQHDFHFYIASVFYYDRGRQVAILLAQKGQSNYPPPIGFLQPIECGFVGRTLREEVTLLVNEVDQAPEYVSPEGYWAAGSELCVPIYAKDKLWGVLNVESAETKAFTYQDQLALEFIANQLGNAIYNLEFQQQ